MIKDLMLEGLQQIQSLPEVNPLHDVMGGSQIRPIASLASLLHVEADPDESNVNDGHDDELDHYADFMEKTSIYDDLVEQASSQSTAKSKHKAIRHQSLH